MINQIINFFKPKVIIVWALLFLISICSSFIMVHELTHVIRLDSPQMLCIGIGENVGKVYCEGLYTESEIFKEEAIANVTASIIILLYITLTFYMIKYYE